MAGSGPILRDHRAELAAALAQRVTALLVSVRQRVEQYLSSDDLYDGRGANKPWLQELPDPVTKIVWQTVVEMHAETALARQNSLTASVDLQVVTAVLNARLIPIIDSLVRTTERALEDRGIHSTGGVTGAVSKGPAGFV